MTNIIQIICACHAILKFSFSSAPIGRNDETNITAPCNADCNCETAFDPVCGANNVMYYTACHAGCREEIESDGNSVNSCIPSQLLRGL